MLPAIPRAGVVVVTVPALRSSSSRSRTRRSADATVTGGRWMQHGKSASANRHSRETCFIGSAAPARGRERSGERDDSNQGNCPASLQVFGGKLLARRHLEPCPETR